MLGQKLRELTWQRTNHERNFTREGANGALPSTGFIHGAWM